MQRVHNVIKQVRHASDSKASTLQMEDDRVKSTLPLDLTFQPSERTRFNARSRIPYSMYSGLASLEQESETERPDAKITVDGDHSPFGTPTKSPSVDNGGRHMDHDRQYSFDTSGHRPYRRHSGESPNLEQERRSQLDVRDEQGRSISPVLEQTKWLLEEASLRAQK